MSLCVYVQYVSVFVLLLAIINSEHGNKQQLWEDYISGQQGSIYFDFSTLAGHAYILKGTVVLIFLPVSFPCQLWAFREQSPAVLL